MTRHVLAPYDAERCRVCGECFHRCPVMRLPIREAVAEMRRLRRGRDTRHVLRRCHSCFACTVACPQEANPTQLILQRWHEAYRRHGMLARASYFTPHAPRNFRADLVRRLPPEEAAAVRRWADRAPVPEILYPGCNWITAPYLARTRALDGIAIRGSLEVCCGETYYRMGLFDQARQAAERLLGFLERMRVRRVVIPCTAGLNMLTNVMPRLGLRVPVQVEHLVPWLLRRVERGELAFTRPLEMTVTVQESCYGKLIGHDLMSRVRTLLRHMGTRIEEQVPRGDRALCCGIAGGFSPGSAFHPRDIARATHRSLDRARRTGADAVVAYCAGCLQMLPLGQLTVPAARRQPVLHLMELVQMALGEPVIDAREKRRRAGLLLAGVARHQGPHLLSRRRLRLPPLETLDA